MLCVSHVNLQLNIVHERINNNCYKIKILAHLVSLFEFIRTNMMRSTIDDLVA